MKGLSFLLFVISFALKIVSGLFVAYLLIYGAYSVLTGEFSLGFMSIGVSCVAAFIARIVIGVVDSVSISLLGKG